MALDATRVQDTPPATATPTALPARLPRPASSLLASHATTSRRLRHPRPQAAGAEHLHVVCAARSQPAAQPLSRSSAADPRRRSGGGRWTMLPKVQRAPQVLPPPAVRAKGPKARGFTVNWGALGRGSSRPARLVPPHADSPAAPRLHTCWWLRWHSNAVAQRRMTPVLAHDLSTTKVACTRGGRMVRTAKAPR